MRGMCYFNPRPPRGGRPACAALHADAEIISIHALREEGDKFAETRVRVEKISIHALREEGDNRHGSRPRLIKIISIHALREEGDRKPGRTTLAPSTFQSTPSARRATAPSLFTGDGNNISIHALREEGDVVRDRPMLFCRKFQSTPSARRATYNHSNTTRSCQDFNPRPPRGGRRTTTPGTSSRINFNPRPPRGGRLDERQRFRIVHAISIHALREEGDLSSISGTSSISYFNPRPPRGGRHCRRRR